MKRRPLSIVSSVLAIALFLQVGGCGYILHPERRGQTGGNIDPAIAIMDGIGILLFIIPGVIAFAVDFSSGAIYYPGGRRGSLDVDDMKQCHFDAEHATPASIQHVLLLETGIDVVLDRDHATVTRLESLDELPARLAALWTAPQALVATGSAVR